MYHAAYTPNENKIFYIGKCSFKSPMKNVLCSLYFNHEEVLLLCYDDWVVYNEK